MSEEPDIREIRIRGSRPDSSDLAQYLLKAFLLLRDRENTEQYVTVNGIGSAIPSALLVAEIIRKKLNVSLVTSLETISKEKRKFDREHQTEKVFQQQLTKIKLKLTFVPTEEEKKSVGYQEPLQVEKEDSRHVDLFDYVMLYVKDLYDLKKKGKIRRDQYQQKQQHRQQRQQQGERMGAQRSKNIQDTGERIGDQDRNERKRDYEGRNSKEPRQRQDDRNNREYRGANRDYDRKEKRWDDRQDNEERREHTQNERGEQVRTRGNRSKYQEKRPQNEEEIQQEITREGKVVKRGSKKAQ